MDNNLLGINYLRETLTYIDVNIIKRNARKNWTLISGLTLSDNEKKNFLQNLKKKLSCSGSIDENGNVKITGDHKKEIKNIIIKLIDFPESRIRIHQSN